MNEYLVSDLRKLGLWDDVMVMDLKHFDGSLRRIDRCARRAQGLYATAFEIETQWLVEAGATSPEVDRTRPSPLNIYISGVSGKKLDETYKLVWLRGLKTSYYLRTMSASSAEKSTVTAGQLNSVSTRAVSQVSPPRCPRCVRLQGRTQARSQARGCCFAGHAESSTTSKSLPRTSSSALLTTPGAKLASDLRGCPRACMSCVFEDRLQRLRGNGHR